MVVWQAAGSVRAFSSGVVIHTVCVILIFFCVHEDPALREEKMQMHDKSGKTCVDVFISSGEVRCMSA
jgi:hypothetical protein